MWAAQRLGWEVFSCELADLFWTDGSTGVFAKKTHLSQDWEQQSTEWCADITPLEKSFFTASAFDIVMMRKDPPFNMDYINATYFLEQAEEKGVLVCNKPQSLRDCNEKFFTTSFPDLTPPQVISQRSDVLLDFHRRHKDVIFKPLDGMGGKGIFRVRENDPNLHVVIETLTKNFQVHIVAQRFIPEISEGDKRILLVNGEAIPYALARIPKDGEVRGNLAAGGIGVGKPLTNRDREIADQIGRELVNRGLYFTGIDVIGDYLTEINVTCPTCVREIDNAFDMDIGLQLMNCLSEIKHRQASQS